MKIKKLYLICTACFILTINLFAGFNKLNYNGFGNPNNIAVSAFAVFSNRLYAGTYNSAEGSEIWRSSDGVNWQSVSSAFNGFGNPNNIAVSAFAVFSNKLYVGTEKCWQNEIWRTANGYDFECVATNAFNFMSDHRIQSLCVFNNYLYAGTSFFGQVWRTADGTNWEQVNIDGFGDWNNQDIVLCVFNNWLYAGTYNSAEGSEIWRSPDGINWTNVSSGGWGTGDSRINSMISFNGYIYASDDGGLVYRSFDGTTWEQITDDGFGSYGSIVSFAVYSNYIYAGSQWGLLGGCRLYRSKTGDSGTWVQVNENGFGNANNDGLVSMTVFSNSLFCGTYNSAEGCEVWSDLPLEINLVKNADVPGGNVSQGSNNVTVLAFSLWDLKGHTITNLRLSNLGTMSNNIDVTNVKLWLDVNGNFLYNPGDVQIGIAQWNKTSRTWDFTGLNLTGKTNYIITIDIAATTVNERTFIGQILKGYIKCNAGAENIIKLQNKNVIAIGSHYVQIIKNLNIPVTDIGGSYYEEALSFRIKDTGYHQVTGIKIRNSGTMQSNIDVQDLWLWYDNVNIGQIDWGQDTWITFLQWDSQEKCWTAYGGLPFDSNRDLLLMVYTTANGIPGRTFIASIGPGDITLSCGSTNTNSIQNANAVTRIDEVVPSKLANITSCTVSINSNNITVMAFEVNDFYWRYVKNLRIANNGTMENGIDITAVKLWQDNNGNKKYDAGDTQINDNGVWNSTNQSWDFNNIWQSSGQDIIVTIDVGSMARNGKTFIAKIKKGDVVNDYDVLNNISITNYGAVTIQGAPHWVSVKTNQIVDYYNYTVKAGFTNKPVLSFKFLDSKAANYLKYLRISNLGSMTGGDITAVKVWKDLGTIGYYDKGIDLFAGYLRLQTISTWTNNNLSIGESTNVLITIDTSPGLANGKTFRAATVSTNDIRCNENKASLICITNAKTLVSDTIPPTAVSIKELYSGADVIRLEWSSCTDSNFFGQYKIAYDTTSHANWQDYTKFTNASTTNITITGLNPNTIYYFRVRALDGAFNEGAPSSEANKKTKQMNLITLYQVNRDGFGDKKNLWPFDMEVFKNRLYLGCCFAGGMSLPVARVFRTSKGTNWTQANTDGFGNANNFITLSYAVFNNYIYASTYNLVTGSEIYRSSDGTNWSSVMTGGFGDANNIGIFKMFVWNGYIYAGTMKKTGTGGCELWRSSDGTTWVQVNSDGFGNPNNTGIVGLGAFGSYLYVGTLQGPNISGGEMYRSSDGITWESISSATNGFGDINNDAIRGLTEFKGYLYAATENKKNGCEIWRSSNGTSWTQVENGGFGNTNNLTIYELTVYSNQLFIGTSAGLGACQLWSSSDGINWIKRSQDNLGDINNEGIIGISVFGNGLFFNVWNVTTGLEVWSDKPYVLNCSVGVAKISDTPGGNVTPNLNNLPVLCFKVTDSLNHKISTIKISKNGTMQNGTDISAVKLWYDKNKNNTWDIGDSYIATGLWNSGDNSWNFTGLSVFSSSNLIATIDIASNAIQGRTFQARIDTTDIICENNFYSTNSIVNDSTLTITGGLIFYVSTNGNNSNSGTSWELAWKTISHSASNVPPNATIYVADGIYNEEVNLIKGRIKFIATNRAIVDGENYCFYLKNITNVQIMNFELKNSMINAIRIEGSSISNVFKNNIIKNNNTTGIYIENSSYNSLKNNVIYSNTGGIVLNIALKNVIESNELYINGNLTYPEILINNSSKNHIVNNKKIAKNQNSIGIMLIGASASNIIGNNLLCSNAMIYLNGSSVSGNIVKSNICFANTIPGVAAIAIQDAFGNYITSGNRIYNCFFGISLAGDAQYNLVKENLLYTNTVAGIYDSATNSNTFEKNLLSHNMIGLYIAGQASANFVTNNIVATNTYGILVQGICKTNIIAGNKVFRNSGVGIAIISNDADMNIIRGNDVYNNGATTNNAGIVIVDGDNNIITANNVFKNNSFGIILVNGASGNLISRNNSYSNNLNWNGCGIVLGSNSINNIIGTNILYANNAGIALDNVKDCILIQNIITENSNYGIYFFGSSSNIKIQYNKIKNSEYGISITNNSTLKLQLNSIISNTYGLKINSGVIITNIKNNIYDNLTNLITAELIKLTNNWWGTTVASDILSKISGLSSYSNFTPYRLFCPYNILPGADTESPNVVTGIMKNISGPTLYLSWNASPGTHHYNIYQSAIPGTANLSYANIIAKITQTNYSFIPHAGTSYYHITACDDYAFTNESWYSAEITNISAHIVLIPDIISPYQTTVNRTEQPVLSFKFTDASNHSLQKIKITNLGSMKNIEDIVKLKLKFGNSVSNLYFSSSQSKWTNDSLSITNNADIIVLLDTASSLTPGRTFIAHISTNGLYCSSGDNLKFSITGPVVTADTNPPIFSNFETKIEEVNKDRLKVSWQKASDNISTNFIIYRIYHSTTSGSYGTIPIAVVTNQLTYEISGLSAGKHYFIIEALDEIGNKTRNNEGSAQIKGAAENLDNVKIYPVPVYKNEVLHFENLTEKIKFRLFSVAGNLIYESDEIITPSGTYEKSIEDFKISSGMYIIVLSSSGVKPVTKKLVFIDKKR